MGVIILFILISLIVVGTLIFVIVYLTKQKFIEVEAKRLSKCIEVGMSEEELFKIIGDKNVSKSIGDSPVTCYVKTWYVKNPMPSKLDPIPVKTAIWVKDNKVINVRHDNFNF